MAKGSRKKSCLFSGPALKRGGGVKGLATKKKKITFFDHLKNPQKILKKNVATKLERVGGKALVAGPLKKNNSSLRPP